MSEELGFAVELAKAFLDAEERHEEIIQVASRYPDLDPEEAYSIQRAIIGMMVQRG